MTVNRCPKVLQAVFGIVGPMLSRPQLRNLQAMVLAGVLVATRGKLRHAARATDMAGHRTSLGHFLTRSEWDEVGVLTQVAMATLKRMKPVQGEELCLIIDDTRIAKRGRQFEAISKMWDHAHQKFVYGHMVVTAAVLFRGVVLPWRLILWLPKDFAGSAYRKTTEIAADMIREFAPPCGLKVRVLFDAFYLCGPVTKACESRGFSWFSVASKNRKLKRKGAGKSGQLADIAPGRLRYQSRRVRMKRTRGWRWMKLSRVDGSLSKIGDVRVVFSKRPGHPWKKILAVATNETSLDERAIVAIYEKRWNIEVLFKELRGTLGLGSYQMQKLRGIERHLHVVCLTHLVLTHHSLSAAGAQARKANEQVPLPTLTQRREVLRDTIRIEQITRFVNRIKHKNIRKRVRDYLLTS